MPSGLQRRVRSGLLLTGVLTLMLLASAGTAYSRRGPSSWHGESRAFSQEQTVRVAGLAGCLRVTSSGTLHYERGVDRTRFVRGLSVVHPTTLVTLESCIAGKLPVTVGRLDLEVRWTTSDGRPLETRSSSFDSGSDPSRRTWASYSTGEPVRTGLHGRTKQCVVAQPYVTPYVVGSNASAAMRPFRVCTSVYKRRHRGV